PANIMIDSRGEPVVMDFGLARRTAVGEDGLTSAGVFVGTPAYASPEQIAGEEALTPASDVYALGAILHELLTGRVPFFGPASELAHRKLTENPEPPSRSAAEVGPELDRVCLKALARPTSRRFASMEEFAAALDVCPTSRAERPPRRRKTIALTLAAGLLVIAAVAVVIWSLSRDPRPDTGTQPPGTPAKEAADLLPVGSRWVGE